MNRVQRDITQAVALVRAICAGLPQLRHFNDHADSLAWMLSIRLDGARVRGPLPRRYPGMQRAESLLSNAVAEACRRWDDESRDRADRLLGYVQLQIQYLRYDLRRAQLTARDADLEIARGATDEWMARARRAEAERDELLRRMWGAAIELQSLHSTLLGWRHGENCQRRCYGVECHDECTAPDWWTNPPAEEGEECDARRCYDERAIGCDCGLDELWMEVGEARRALAGGEVDDDP